MASLKEHKAKNKGAIIVGNQESCAQVACDQQLRVIYPKIALKGNILVFETTMNGVNNFIRHFVTL